MLHGSVLALANLVAILIGFAIYKAMHSADQIAVQLLVGVLLSIGLFSAWMVAFTKLPLRRLRLAGMTEFMWVYAASLACGPAVFVPLHYATQGYLTSGSNLLALFLYQAPVNALSVLVAVRVTGRRAGP
jgi:hypothetical protein